MAFQGTSRTLTQQSSAATSDDLQKILFSPEAIKKMATECDLGRHHWMRADNAISQQSSAATSDDLQKILFSPEAIKKMATECDLGRHHWMRADNAISVRPLVPEVTHGRIASFFKSGYDVGELRSKGYMSVPQVLCAVTRTVSTDAEGSLRIYLADLGDKVKERQGYIWYTGTTACVCGNGQARLSFKNNNYNRIAAGKTLVLPFNRLAEQTKPSAVARLLKSQLNNIESSQYVLTNARIDQNARSESEELIVESPPAAIGSSSASRSEAHRPQVVNGL
uniref:Movement protein n=1 Tax=Cucumber mosaic virus TaxID=12305 RepID=Q659R1_9BROM|nr:movement protein [Cucumber mosaic virus]